MFRCLLSLSILLFTLLFSNPQRTTPRIYLPLILYQRRVPLTVLEASLVVNPQQIP